jgi:hypothetical protein
LFLEVTSKSQRPFFGGMGGKEAIRRLREIDSDVKAIVASGYSNDPWWPISGITVFAALCPNLPE